MLFSAKRRRKRFGIIKEVVNASEYMLVPKKEARVISRIKPIMREAKVISERTIPDFKSDFFESAFFCSDMIKKNSIKSALTQLEPQLE